MKQNTMKIRLQNFKCYEDNTFDFGESGIVLLSGQSGLGKSSIVQGIYFALFGYGNKITMSGKNNCRVDLEFDGMTVARSKNPSRLVVNGKYEDETGQKLIDGKFGSTFETTGYIPQNAMKSFIMMSANDKLSFLEKFAFGETDLVAMKTKCKDLISETNDDLIRVTAKLECANEMADTIDEPEEVDFPIKVKNGNYEKAISNENIRYANTKFLIGKANEKYRNISARIHAYEVATGRISGLHETETSLWSDLRDAEIELTNSGEVLSPCQIASIHESIDGIESDRMVEGLCIKEKEMSIDLEQMVKASNEERIDELRIINDSLWIEYTPSEVAVAIIETSDLLNDARRLDALESKRISSAQIETLRGDSQCKRDQLIDMELSTSRLKCPSCSASVRLNGHMLTRCESSTPKPHTGAVSKNEIEIDLRKLDREIRLVEEIDDISSSYDEALPPCLEIMGDLEYLRKYEFTNRENEERKDELEAIDISCPNRGCKRLKRDLDDIRLRISSIPRSDNSDVSETVLRAKIETHNINTVLRNRIDESIKALKHKVTSIEVVIKRLTGDIEKGYDKNELPDLENELTELETTQKMHATNLKIIESWSRMRSDLKKYTNAQDRVIHLQIEESRIRKEMVGFSNLRETIIESESIALLNVMDSINTHARIYLDSFFADEPISVNLRPFKQTKKLTKAQINLEIEYKGMDCDLSNMSGGEIARIVLAYTLALAEMFNTPLILLDECTASLDQETADDVFECIRENFSGKIAILIAHQVVTGAFDKTIVAGPTQQ